MGLLGIFYTGGVAETLIGEGWFHNADIENNNENESVDAAATLCEHK